MRGFFFRLNLWLFVSFLMIGGVSGETLGAVDPPAAKKPLYERIGGEPVLRAIVQDVVTRSLSDPEINFTRQGTQRAWSPTPLKMQNLMDRMVRFFSMSCGGPQIYDGRPLKDLHAGMEITDAEFEAFMGALRASLDRFEIPPSERNEMLLIAEKTREEIVMA